MKKDFLLVAALLVSMLFTGCKNDNYLSVLPDDPALMCKVNVGTLLNKSAVLQNKTVASALNLFASQLPAHMQEIYTAIVEDPSNSGIDFTRPIVLSMFTNDFENVKGVVVAPVGDAGKLKELVETVLKESGMEIKEIDGYNYVVCDDEPEEMFAFDNEKVVLAYDSWYLADIDVKAYLAEGSKAVENAKYDEFFANTKDVALYLDYSTICNAMEEQGIYASLGNNSLDALKDMAMLMDLNFENGAIVLDTKVSAGKEYEDMVRKYWEKPSREHYGYIPENSFMVMNSFLCGKMILDNPLIKGQWNDISEELDFDFSKLSSISGDMTFALLRPQFLGNTEVPQLMFVVDCENKELFNEIVSAIENETELKSVENDVYALGMNEYSDFDYDTYEWVSGIKGYDYYLMYKDEKIAIIPENIYKEINDGDDFKDLAQSAEDNRIFTSSNAVIAVDIKSLVEEIEPLMKHGDDKTVLDVIKMFKSIEVLQNDPMEVTTKINLYNTNENSLKLLVDKAVALAASNLGDFF